MNKEKSHKAKGDKKNAAMAFLQRSASLNYKNSEAMPQQKLPDMMNNTKIAKDRVDSALCECIYDNNLSPCIVESTTFRKFLHALKAHGPVGHEPLARHATFGQRLDDRAASARSKRQQLYAAMVKNGFTCGSDGARINKHPLVNFVMFNVGVGNINWTTKDCSDHLAAGGVKNAEFIADTMLDQAQDELTLEQIQSWVLLVLDGASNNMSAMPKLKGEPSFLLLLYISPCLFFHRFG
jgi:hypothetical protein